MSVWAIFGLALLGAIIAIAILGTLWSFCMWLGEGDNIDRTLFVRSKRRTGFPANFFMPYCTCPSCGNEALHSSAQPSVIELDTP